MTNPFGIINSEDQTIIYTSFNKVKDIFELNNNIKFTYGIDDTRKKMESLSAELIRYYSHFNFEQDENIDSEILAERNYIFSPSGLAAIYEIVNQVGTMYYIHTDHIGSLNVISDESGNLVQEMSYDAWGRRRNPNNWSYSGIPANYKFERGFTGHEHMDGNGLINMNGRMYDPILGRFLSSDPIVLYPDYSQDYNKYSYARNNPLVYYDPSGLYPIYNPNGEFWYDSEDYSIRYTIDEVNNWFEVVGMLVDAETATYLFTTINGEYGVSINGYFYTLFEMELKDLAFYEASLFEEDLGEMENWYYGLDATNGGDEFNWGIPLGVAGTATSAGVEYAENMVRTSFKTGRNPVSWSKLTPKQQAWRTANVLGKNAKYVKYAKGAGIVGTGISVGMAGYDIASGQGTTIDYFDVGVGTASIGAAIFLASNPVGWVIGAGAAVYFAGRLVYDIYEEVND